MMIEHGGQACFMKDKKGYLPAHVACSRHCSPEKLRMLLAVNPHALFDKTNDGHTLMDLAKKLATKSHPNFALIEELNRHLAGTHRVSSEEDDSANRSRLDSNDSAKSWHTYESSLGSPSQHQQGPFHQYHHPYPVAYAQGSPSVAMAHHPQSHNHPPTFLGLDEYQPTYYRAFPGEGSMPSMLGGGAAAAPPAAPRKKKRASRKRKTSNKDDNTMVDDTQPAADLLLQFSRGNNITGGGGSHKSPRRVKKESPGRRAIHDDEAPRLAAMDLAAADTTAEDEPLPVVYQQLQQPTQVTEV